MFQYGVVAGGLNIKHQHPDGSWAEMAPRDAHDAAEFDEERDWQRGHVYVCRQCEETIEVSPPDDGPAAPGPG
jgi:hypothetical protein